jgi:tetratricopeptide (TPR) repeat protein
MSHQNRIRIALFTALMAAVLFGCKTSPQAKEAKYLKRGEALVAKKDYARALLEFRNAANAMPKDAEPYYQLGLVSLETGDPAAAARAFRKATELNPKHAGAQLKFAEMMVNTRNKGLVEEAAKRLETILANTPENSEASGTLAVAEWKLGQAEDATKRLEETLQKFPTNLQSSVTLAKMKLSQNDLAGAQEVLQKAVASAPKSPQAALALGQLYWLAKQPEKAEAEMKRALQLDPKNGPALLGLAALQVSGRRMEEAEQTYQRLSAFPDKDYKPLHALFLFQTGKRDAALTELLKLAKEDPKDRAARSRVLAAYVSMGKIHEAQRLLAAALKENSKDTDALFQRAELSLRSGNAAGAKEDLRQVLHFKPDSAQAHFALAEVYRAERSPQSRQELNEALRLNAGMLAARLALARSFTLSNEPKSALQVLDATPENQKRMMGTILERNWALFATGNSKEMRGHLDEALKYGRYPELLIQDGVLRLREGDFVGARAVADEVLRRNSEEVRAARILVDSYVNQKEPKKALGRLTELAQGHLKSAPLQDLLGQFQFANGMLADARKSFEAAKAADPNFLTAEISMAEIDFKESHFDSARQHLTTVLAADPKNVRALLLLAEIEGNAGNRAEAMARYRAVINIQSNNLFALNNLAYTLALDNPDEALKYARQAGEIAPDNANVQDTLGWIYYRKGIYGTATDYLKTAVARDPTPRRQFHLGMAYLKAGNRDLGQKTVMAALQKDPNLPKTEQGW